MLALAVFAFAAAAVQAAPAAADYWGAITTADPAQGTARVVNAAGCGNPANAIEWTWTTTNCSGGGSNERWDINVSAAENIGGGGSAIWAHYNGHYMCLNVRYASYTSGQQIVAYNCDGGATGNEKFYLLPCSTSGACGASYGLIEPVGAYPSPGLCLNIAGGFGLGHNIVLYRCSGTYTNELFSLPGW